MADTIQLSGRLADITSRPVESITRVTVKAPTFMPNGAGEITTTQPANVDFDIDGMFSVGVVQGVGWLFVEGDSWSDSIRFVAAEGMSTLWEAVVNALPLPLPMKSYLSMKADMKELIDAAVAAVPTSVRWPKGYLTTGEFPTLEAVPDGAYWVSNANVATAFGLPNAGIGVVETFTVSTVVYQRWTTRLNGNAVTFQRVKYGNTAEFSPWTRFLNDAEDAWFKGAADPAVYSLETLPAGFWGVWSADTARTYSLPIENAGLLENYQVGSIRFQRFTSNSYNNPVTYQREKFGANAQWTQWQSISPFNAVMTSGDLDTVTSPGSYPIANTAIANMPSTAYGTLEVSQPTMNRYLQRYTTFENPPRVYSRTRYSGQQWSSWANTSGFGSVDASQPMTRKAMLVQELKARKGGRIGVGDKAVVCLRFDDAPQEFVDIALPLLTELRLPFSRVTTTESIGDVVIDPAVFPAMQDYCIRYGGEVWNHGRTHMGATGYDTIRAETIEPLYVLRERMPRIPIDCYAPPGMGSTFDGHMSSDAPENWFNSIAGMELHSHHAIASGYMDSSLYRQLDGVVRDGQRHWSCDGWTLSRAKSFIKTLQDERLGACLMWHANKVSADFEAILQFIAAERDAARLVVLTNTGLECADASTTYRRNLLKGVPSAAFEHVWTGYDVECLQGYRGATVELVCEITGMAGQTITTNICGVEIAHTLVEGAQTIRQVATIPLDATEIRFSCTGNVTSAKCLQL